MNVLCTACHLNMEEVPVFGAQILMRRPREVLLPDRILNVHVFECPRCRIKTVISFDVDQVERAPGHAIRDVLAFFKRDMRCSLFFNYLNALDAGEGEDLGFTDRAGLITPPASSG